LIARIPLFPLLFVAPRGLVTILLFFGIPASMAFPLVNKSLVIQVIVLTALFMMIGLMVTGKKRSEDKVKGKQSAIEEIDVSAPSGDESNMRHLPLNETGE